jgi:hypothetical protein
MQVLKKLMESKNLDFLSEEEYLNILETLTKRKSIFG